MSDSYERIYQFFAHLGFSIYRGERLESFGDYIIEGCSSYFCVKGVRDRLVESIELRSLSEPDNWFDLGVVMACAGYQDMLDQEGDLESDMKFVESHLDELAELFDEENYPATKVRLIELGHQRARSRWPDWYK